MIQLYTLVSRPSERRSCAATSLKPWNTWGAKGLSGITNYRDHERTLYPPSIVSTHMSCTETL